MKAMVPRARQSARSSAWVSAIGAQVDGHQLAHIVGTLPRDQAVEADPGVLDEQIDRRDPALAQEALDRDGASRIGEIDLAVGLIGEESRVERRARSPTEQHQPRAARGIGARERQPEPIRRPADHDARSLVAHERLHGSVLARHRANQRRTGVQAR